MSEETKKEVKKISNQALLNEVNLKKNKLYDLQKSDPRLIELAKKGLLAEQLLKKEIFETYINLPTKKDF